MIWERETAVHNLQAVLQCYFPGQAGSTTSAHSTQRFAHVAVSCTGMSPLPQSAPDCKNQFKFCFDRGNFFSLNSNLVSLSYAELPLHD